MSGSEPELSLCWYLFREHHLTPGRFFRMPEGEKQLLRAFFELEMEGRRRT